MPERVYETECVVPADVGRVFAFFADAFYLERITPPWLKSHVLTARPIEMRAGTLIDYRLRLRGVPVRWRTRIALWEPDRRFVDEQVKGPYRQWIHEHTFEAVPGGTRMRDRVRYVTPLDWLVHGLVVRPDVERIFEYRRLKISEEFGGETG